MRVKNSVKRYFLSTLPSGKILFIKRSHKVGFYFLLIFNEVLYWFTLKSYILSKRLNDTRIYDKLKLYKNIIEVLKAALDFHPKFLKGNSP